MKTYNKIIIEKEEKETDDLISRQAAIDAMLDKFPYIDPMKIMWTLCVISPAQPEIIRCKDCKYCEHWYRDRRRCFLWSEDGVSVFDDGFCNYAERKEE